MQKVKIKLPSDPVAIPTLGVYPKKMKSLSQKVIPHKDVFIKEVKMGWQVSRIRHHLPEPLDEEAFFFVNGSCSVSTEGGSGDTCSLQEKVSLPGTELS